MADPLMSATLAVAAVNAALSAGLLVVYARSYSRVRAPFTVGLLLFALFFLLHNALAIYSYLTMMPLFPEAVAPYLLAIMALEAVALAIMLWSANK